MEKEGNTMNIQCKSGLLELCVLSILSRGEYNGFEIQNELDNRVKISDGTIYPTMRRLVKEGNVELCFRELEDGVKRKYYKLTTSGEDRTADLEKEWNRLILGVSRILGGEHECKEKNS